MQLDAESEEDSPIQEELLESLDKNHLMEKGFHIGMVQTADIADVHFRWCFNCLEEGHWWQEFKKQPLLPELQEILDREALKRKGVAGNKGDHIPMPKAGRVKPADNRQLAAKPTQ